MRILFLSKRRPQQRDLFTRPYGRFFYLPKYLAEHGHDVHLLLLSYKHEAAEQTDVDSIHCYSESLRPWGPGAYLRRAEQLIQDRRPDWIVGLSDIWYGLAASYLGRKHAIRVFIDAYDNYESYIPWLKPAHWAWRRVLGKADAVTAAGPGLAHYMAGERGQVVPMAADPIFQPMDRNKSRRALNLPDDRFLIGYTGAIVNSRNIDLLFQAVLLLRDSMPNLELVLSGRTPKSLALPEGIRSLGYVQDAQMPAVMNSLDVLAVMNHPSAFGHYSYPVKLYEAMRCQIPVVATATDSVRWILQQHPECLVNSAEPVTFANALKRALQRRRKPYQLPHDNSWDASGRYFLERLEAGCL